MRRYRCFFPKLCPLRYSKLMLLIDDHNAELLKLYNVFNYGMRAYQDLNYSF
jgi:hypothetical protein